MSNRVTVDCAEGLAPPDWLSRVEPFAQKALEALGVDGWELSIMMCEDSFMQSLNSTYRGIDSPTDVLSFEQGDEYVDDEGKTWLAAGDIVVSLGALARNCEDFSVGLDEELKRLLVHGMLHLDGMDHSDNSPEQEMLRLQERTLDRLSGERIVGE